MLGGLDRVQPHVHDSLAGAALKWIDHVHHLEIGMSTVDLQDQTNDVGGLFPGSGLPLAAFSRESCETDEGQPVLLRPVGDPVTEL